MVTDEILHNSQTFITLTIIQHARKLYVETHRDGSNHVVYTEALFKYVQILDWENSLEITSNGT